MIKTEALIADKTEVQTLEDLVRQGISREAMRILGLLDDHAIARVTGEDEEAIAQHAGESLAIDIGTENAHCPENMVQSVANALNYIRDAHQEGKTPTVAEVSRATGWEPRKLGIRLGKLGISSKNTRHDKKTVRLYPLDTRNRIEAVLKELEART